MSIAHFSPYHYVLLFIALIFVFIVLIVKFPSLKRRSKRNVPIYLIVGLLLSLTAYQAYAAFLGPAIVSYSVVTDGDQFYAGRINQFNVFCSSLGRRATSFDLVINTFNASFTANTHDFEQLNSTAIKLPLNFNRVHEEQSTSVSFRISENVTSCVFLFIIDPTGPIPTDSTRKISGEWSSTLGCYLVRTEYTPCV